MSLQNQRKSIKWTKDEIMTLIDAYKNEPSLYDISSFNYRSKKERYFALRRVGNAVRSINVKIQDKDCFVKFHALRSQYNKEKSKVNTSMTSGKVYQPTLWYFSSLKFLDSYFIPRKGKILTDDQDSSMLNPDPLNFEGPEESYTSNEESTSSQNIVEKSFNSDGPVSVYIKEESTSSFINEDLKTSSFVKEELSTSSLIKEELSTSSFINEDLSTSSFVKEDLSTPSFIKEELSTSSLIKEELTSSDMPPLVSRHIEAPEKPEDTSQSGVSNVQENLRSLSVSPPLLRTYPPISPALSSSSGIAGDCPPHLSTLSRKRKRDDDSYLIGVIKSLTDSLKNPIVPPQPDPVESCLVFLGSILRIFKNEDLKYEVINNMMQTVLKARDEDIKSCNNV